jgi:hypothetical protein
MACVLASCSSNAPRVASPTLPAPPLTSVGVDGSGFTASVAMGDLSEPVNTFWQLLYRPDSSSRWTLITPPGTATNGGVVVAPSTTGALTTGILASLGLTFSPLAATPNLGGNWATGVLPGPLAVVPSSIAIDGSRVLALLGTDRGEVVESRGAFTASSWTSIGDIQQLQALRDASGCDVGALTALAAANGVALVGARCATSVPITPPSSTPRWGAGVPVADGMGSTMPLFVRIDDTWEAGGPSFVGPSEVLRISPAHGGFVAVIESRTGTTTNVAVLRITDGQGIVERLGSIALDGGTVASSAVDRAGVTDLVVRSAGGTCRAYAFGFRDARVVGLPALPVGACVVVGAPGNLQSLRIEGSIVLVYGVGPAHRWQVVQRLVVPIQYGSSS